MTGMYVLIMIIGGLYEFVFCFAGGPEKLIARLVCFLLHMSRYCREPDQLVVSITVLL
jgi:hypothetical protein